MAELIKKYIHMFQILVALVLYTLIQETMYFIFSLFEVSFQGNTQLLQLLALIVAAMISMPMYYKWYRYHIRFKKHIVIKEALSIKNIITIGMIGITINLLIASLIELFNISSYFAGYEESISILTKGNIVLSSILVIFLAPVCEELIHRGIVYENIKISTSKVTANFIQAAIFAIVHQSLLQMIYSFVLGLLLGYIYEKNKSIYAPILVHSLFNATSIINSQLFSNEMKDNNLLMVSLCIISSIIFFICIEYVKKSPTIQYIPEPGVKMVNLREFDEGKKTS